MGMSTDPHLGRHATAVTSSVRERLAVRLAELGDHPAVAALRVVVNSEHISIPGSGGLCIDCGWMDPCPTLITIAISLGVIDEDHIADGELRAEWASRTSATLDNRAT
jgi:hypothetical protein